MLMLYQTNFNILDMYDNADFYTSLYCKKENIMWDVSDSILHHLIIQFSPFYSKLKLHKNQPYCFYMNIQKMIIRFKLVKF